MDIEATVEKAFTQPRAPGQQAHHADAPSHARGLDGSLDGIATPDFHRHIDALAIGAGQYLFVPIGMAR